MYASVLTANMIYVAKIMAYYCSVVGTFNTICYGGWDIQSIVVAIVAFDAFVLYLVCFGGMYVIPDLAEQLRKATLNAIEKAERDFPRRKILFQIHRKKSNAVRPIRIKEGEFRHVSRNSTPEFIDFYINQVIALTLAFR